MLNLRRFMSWRVVALCRALLRHEEFLLLHRDSWCGHVSLLLLWHNVQLRLVCVWGQKIFFFCLSQEDAHYMGKCKLLLNFPKMVRNFVVYLGMEFLWYGGRLACGVSMSRGVCLDIQQVSFK